jgi:hypothetical protein
MNLHFPLPLFVLRDLANLEKKLRDRIVRSSSTGPTKEGRLSCTQGVKTGRNMLCKLIYHDELLASKSNND